MYSSELQTANTEESVLCMTDMSTDMSIMQHPAYSSTVATSGHNECDSDTSGYMSTASLDSTGEERRLTANADKIMSVWNCWSQNIDTSFGSKCSTPKHTSQRRVLKMRVNLKTGSRCFAQKSRSEGDLRRLDAWKTLDFNFPASLDSGLNTFSSIQCKSYAN
ncbi:hypothetical protein DPMN_175044 [Dreissena polymorpha]|uniref:Uncharacterized protein n=1 Tax=Dreissena polymorpha TaxID=45954 RepID=A0A9D4IFP0_DREPO|nr:hypothetical protein DPMN_175044 [Dreissena polymorpha]